MKRKLLMTAGLLLGLACPVVQADSPQSSVDQPGDAAAVAAAIASPDRPPPDREQDERRKATIRRMQSLRRKALQRAMRAIACRTCGR
jgi:predicted methyltransferase